MDGRTDGYLDGRSRRKKKIWGMSLGSFLAKNHPNRSYSRALLAMSKFRFSLFAFRIAEGASRGGPGGAGAPPCDAMPGKEKQTPGEGGYLAQILAKITRYPLILGTLLDTAECI